MLSPERVTICIRRRGTVTTLNLDVRKERHAAFFRDRNLYSWRYHSHTAGHEHRFSNFVNQKQSNNPKS